MSVCVWDRPRNAKFRVSYLLRRRGKTTRPVGLALCVDVSSNQEKWLENGKEITERGEVDGRKQ